MVFSVSRIISEWVSSINLYKVDLPIISLVTAAGPALEPGWLLVSITILTKSELVVDFESLVHVEEGIRGLFQPPVHGLMNYIDTKQNVVI
jgi:hypothetical protein